MPSRPPLSDAQRRVFAALILLDRVLTTGAFHAALMEEKDDALLEPTFRHLQQEDLVEVGEDDRYRATARGRRAYAGLLERRQSYLAHFELFARVDLAEGAFAEPDDPYGDPRWSDLRVAVAEYKGIDPYRVVFLAMLSEEAFFRERDWKFDLALGSTLFRELEEIVASQLGVAALGYDTETGEHVSGDAVLEDVILQGARRNRAAWEKERRRAAQTSLLPDEEPSRAGPALSEAEGTPAPPGTPTPPGAAAGANGGDEEAEPYDPLRAMAFYEDSALYVEPIWLADFW